MLPTHDARICLRRGYAIHHIADLVRLEAVKRITGSNAAKRAHLLSETNVPVDAESELEVQKLIPV